MNISQYVSMSVLGRDIVVIEDLKELTHQLAKLGNNLNQVTMLAHHEKIKEVDLPSVKKVVEEIWQLLWKSVIFDKKEGCESWICFGSFFVGGM